MSLGGFYLRVSQTELDEYIATSSKLEERISSDSYFSDKNITCVELNWDGIFFLLTGFSIDKADQASEPFRWLLAPPQKVDPNLNLDYGPPGYISVSQTKEIAEAINNITNDELKNRYNPKRMTELSVYPSRTWERDGDIALEELFDSFIELKNCFNTAAAEDQAVIFYLI